MQTADLRATNGGVAVEEKKYYNVQIAELEVKKKAPRPKLLLDSIKFLRQSYNVTPILKMA